MGRNESNQTNKQNKRKWYQQMNVVRLKPLGSRTGQTVLIKIRPYNIDKDQAPTILIKIGPGDMD